MAEEAKKKGSYEGLRFSFSDMEKEIDYMLALAGPFLEPDTRYFRMAEFKRLLADFRHNPGIGGLSWSIPRDKPIETVDSEGQYEAYGRRGSLRVFGRISGAWEIVADAEDDERSKYFRVGQASLKVSIWKRPEEGEPSEIARWSSDIGVKGSPGCHFHTQIDLDEPHTAFPKDLSVPRLPGLLHTPMDQLEFLLAELFQDRWSARASKGSQIVNSWSNQQRPRLLRMLAWQGDTIRKATGSPWTVLKNKKPPLTMLLEGAI